MNYGTYIGEEFERLRDAKWFMGNVSKVILENKKDNHYKYYHLSQEEPEARFWKAAWGRIGSRPQTKDYDSRNEELMYDKFIEKLSKKGYTIRLYETFGGHTAAYYEFMEYIGASDDLFD